MSQMNLFSIGVGDSVVIALDTAWKCATGMYKLLRGGRFLVGDSITLTYTLRFDLGIGRIVITPQEVKEPVYVDTSCGSGRPV